jgi:protoheme IX farnesyltransferase
MFTIVFLWTPPHFWALAIPYTSDYAAAGVPMLPVTKGAIEARRRSLVYAVVMVGTSLALFLTGDVGYVYLVISGLAGAIFLWLAVRQVREATNAAAVALFRYSISYLALIFGAMVIDRLLPL